MWSVYASHGAISYDDAKSIAFKPDGTRLVVALNDETKASSLTFLLLDTADGSKKSAI